MSTTPITDLVKVEVLVPPTSGAFILGRNFVGQPLSAAGAESVWTDYLCEARNVNITRGGSQDGIVTSLDVGTASVSLVNAGNPLDSPNIKPNRPVRISSGERPITTVPYSETFDDGIYPSTMNPYAANFTVTFPDEPGRGKVMNISAAVSGYGQGLGFPELFDVRKGDTYTFKFDVRGADSNQKWVSWAVIDRTGILGMTNSGPIIRNQNLNSPLSTEWASREFSWTATADYAKVGMYVTTWGNPTPLNVFLDNMSVTRVRVEPQLLFTGDIQDVFMDYDRDGNEFVSFTASDGIRSVNNTQRYGAVVENGVGFETWAQRTRRLAQSASTATNPPGDEGQDRIFYTLDAYTEGSSAWTSYGKPSRVAWIGLSAPYAGNWTGTVGGHAVFQHARVIDGTAITIPAGSWGIQKTVTGLTPGRRYAFRASTISTANYYTYDPRSWMVGVSGIGWSEPVATPTAGKSYALQYEFVATSTTHTLRYAPNTITVPNGQVQPPIMYNYLVAPTLVEFLENTIVLQDVAYESTLANHFNVASNSVGAVWWADKKNIIQFKRALDADVPVANFSDEHMPTERPIKSERYNLATVPLPKTGNTGASRWAYFASSVGEVFSLVGPMSSTFEFAPGLFRDAWITNVSTPMTATPNSSTWRSINHVRLGLTIPAGRPRTYSMYVSLNQTQASPVKARISVYGAPDDTANATLLGTSTSSDLTGTDWTRFNVTVTPSQAYAWTRVYVQINNASIIDANNGLRSTALLIENGSTLGGYFDGDSLDGSDADYSWTGPINNSLSAETVYAVTPPRTNLCEDPLATTTTTAATWAHSAGTGGVAAQSVITNALDGPREDVTSYRRAVYSAASTGGSRGPYFSQALTGDAGDVVSLGLWVRSSRVVTGTMFFRFYNGGTVLGNTQRVNTTLNAGEWTRLDGTVTATGAYTTVRAWFVPTNTAPNLGQVGDVFDWTGGLVERSATVGEFFSGATPSTQKVTREWTGTPNASTSVESYIEYDPMHVCYTNIKGDYATANVINDVTLANHGRDALTGNTADVNYRKQDITSVASWGSRAATVDTSIYNSGAFAGSVDVRAKEITDEWGNPEVSISEVTFDPRSAIERVDLIDIFSRVNVTYKGNTYTCRVTKISHSIQPDKWLTTLELRKD